MRSKQIQIACGWYREKSKRDNRIKCCLHQWLNRPNGNPFPPPPSGRVCDSCRVCSIWPELSELSDCAFDSTGGAQNIQP
mmetsp:Transcript_19588/g.44848  ORF Transcript_19588/g.44848 Transcript_19588/m.44848 type:complete len:80 (+) Transcript_19588:1335-1574(+)